MDSEIYLSNTDNIFHQLRGHYLKLNKEEHSDFTTFCRPPKPEKKRDPSVPERQNMQVNIFEARLRKLQYVKLRKKGGALDEESSEKNLQTASSSGYYSLDDLWKKLSVNDADRESGEVVKGKSWRQLSLDEQKMHLKEFIDKFRDSMDLEVWREMRISLIKQLKEGAFDVPGIINWHKGTQKILEISGFIINPACFYWN